MIDNVNAHRNSQTDTTPSQAEQLSREVYSDPKSYLAALKSDFLTLDTKTQGFLDKEELKDYIAHGKDNSVKEVAQLTLDHFDGLQQLENEIPNALDKPPRGVSPTDLQLLNDAMDGNSKPYIDRDTAYLRSDLGWGIAFGVLYAGMGIAEVSSGLAWFAPFSALPGLAFSSSVIYNDYKALSTAPKFVNDKFNETRQQLSSWSEFTKK